MKIFFPLILLAPAFAHQDEHKKVLPIKRGGGEFEDHERKLQSCTCSIPKPEVENCGFVYDGDSATACVQRLVAASSDDAEERPTGAMSLEDDDLDLGPEVNYTSAVRFTDIPIPNGATIISAYIEFTAEESDSNLTNLVIQGEDSDDAPTFTDTDFDISSRPTTTAQVNWNNVPAWTEGNTYQTPDLSSILREIVNRDGWSQGNAVVFIIPPIGTGDREAQSFDGALEDDCAPSCIPKLFIQFAAQDGTPDPSIFKRDGSTGRLIGASGYPNKSWKLRGYPQGDEGEEAILPGNVYDLPYDGSSYPEELIIKIKVAASSQWLNVNARAKFQYRLWDCSGLFCSQTQWMRVINFDGPPNGANVPPREGSSVDQDPEDGFFEQTLDLTTSGCYNYDYRQIEFQILNTNAANEGTNNKDFFVRQFYMDVKECEVDLR